MKTHIFLLLDMTASMMWNKEANIDSCNEFISNQQLDSGAEDSLFSLGVFNSNIGMERIVKEVPLDRAPHIDYEHYRPNGATPLYDAIAQSVDLLDSSTDSVLFIIQTDGKENSSQNATRKEVIEKIAQKSELGWQFVYLGCDIDAMTEGKHLGISPGNTFSYTRKDTAQAFNFLTSNTREYLKRGSTSSDRFFDTQAEDS